MDDQHEVTLSYCSPCIFQTTPKKERTPHLCVCMFVCVFKTVVKWPSINFFYLHLILVGQSTFSVDHSHIWIPAGILVEQVNSYQIWLERLLPSQEAWVQILNLWLLDFICLGRQSQCATSSKMPENLTGTTVIKFTIPYYVLPPSNYD